MPLEQLSFSYWLILFVMSLAITEIAQLRTSKAGLHILISGEWQFCQLFDYVITIQEEVRWVWGRSWNATRAVFVVSRYLPFLGTALTAYGLYFRWAVFDPVLINLPCPFGNAENGDFFYTRHWRIRQLKVKFSVIHVIGIIASETLLVLRTYAFWGRSKRLLYGLIACSAELPSDPCLLESSVHGALVYVALLLYEIVILALMLYVDRTHPISRWNVLRPLHYLLRLTAEEVITLANVIIGLSLPASHIFDLHIQKPNASPQDEYSDLLETAQIVLHSVLASRIMFNLRKSVHYSQEGGMGNALFGSVVPSDLEHRISVPLSDLAFAEPRTHPRLELAPVWALDS
ncbi:hypothetical protein BU15DRAFT_68826 [Melanogaster broomeanus]|nr:hypothetical protein BU15DRAFT_68826 [Melanogaster broomeanus]